MDKSKLEQFLAYSDVESFEDRYAQDISEIQYFGFPIEPILKAEERLTSKETRSLGYFSMEYGLSANTYNVFTSVKPISSKNQHTKHRVFSNLRAMDYYLRAESVYRFDIPIYSGGLGILAGDSLKSIADSGLSLTAVGILWNKGYFKQNFWFNSGQIPHENEWDPATYPGLIPLKTRVSIPLRTETIHLRLWKYYVYSFDRKSVVPLVLLDSHLAENSAYARALTDQLYRSDNGELKILQRIILGMGGMKAFEALGYSMDSFHLNEGHAAFAVVEQAKKTAAEEFDSLKEKFSYTCHTPVVAGHDRFGEKLVESILPESDFQLTKRLGTDPEHGHLINLTRLAMNMSSRINAVSKKHCEIMHAQFPHDRSRIQYVTNGIHTNTWISPAMAELFDRFQAQIGAWRENPAHLKNVLTLKNDLSFREALWIAHQTNKNRLCELFRHWNMKADVFTLCWARRIAAYKRPSLILQDVKKLIQMSKEIGPIQILIAGKAHPQDDLGFTYINDMLSAIDALEPERDTLRVAMLENYNSYFGKLLTSSTDVWLNNPLPPFEASGTSGMKAILNGVLQLSTLDGWMIEAQDKNIGWIFGWRHETSDIGNEHLLRLKEDSEALYGTLESIIELYYQTNQSGKVNLQSEWIDKMISAISEAGYFNTDRMIHEYQEKIWSNHIKIS